MVQYVRAELGWTEDPIASALRLTQQRLHDEPPMAMNWMIVHAFDREVFVHEGGTGGFSSLVALDPTRARAVIVLSDTSWNALGGLGGLAQPLIDERFPTEEPRKIVTPSAGLLAGLSGRYELAAGLDLVLTVKEGVLYGQATGQGKFALGYDSAGDFFAQDFDAILRPSRDPGGDTFTWFQGGGAFVAKRRDTRLHTRR